MAWSSVSALLGLPLRPLRAGQGPRGSHPRQQAKLLEVQSGQLELRRRQLDEQRQVNTRQAEVVGLRAADLRESPEERKRKLTTGAAAGVVLREFPQGL